MTAQAWIFNAAIGPTVVSSTLVIAATISLFYKIFVSPLKVDLADGGGIHMDLESNDGDDIGTRLVLSRAAQFFGWFIAFLACMAMIGMLPTVPLVLIAYMRIEGREPWRLCLILAVCVTLVLYFVFDQIIHIPWPESFLGTWFPILGQVVPSM